MSGEKIFRHILEILRLQGLQKKFCGHFHDLCVQKWRCLLWSSEAILKFSTCKVYRKSSGCIFTIHSSKHQAVCCEVQMHFGSFHLARFTEKILVAFSQFMVSKMNRFAVNLRQNFEVLNPNCKTLNLELKSLSLCILHLLCDHFNQLCVTKGKCNPMGWTWNRTPKNFYNTALAVL